MNSWLRRMLTYATLIEEEVDPTEWVQRSYIVYNLDNNRNDDQVTSEINALLTTFEPDFMGLVEAIGNVTPRVRGYRRIRDRSNRSRANLAVYISRKYRESLYLKWVRLKMTWPRTKRAGTHESRSLLTVPIDRLPFTLFHAPHWAVKDGEAAQAEHADALVAALTPRNSGPLAVYRPRIAAGDMNRRAESVGIGVDEIAARVGGEWHGGRIDAGVTRGQIEVLSTQYITEAGDVALQSDHGRAMLVVFSVPRMWMR